MNNLPFRLSQFTEIKELGKGEHGRVFLSKYLDNQIYAIKEINFDDVEGDQYKYLKREISIMENLKNINHPHIIKYFGYFMENNNIYLILEYINGENLEELSEKYKFMNQYFDQSFIILILSGIINGLFYLHRQKIIHRDISADNIMIDINDYSIKITDFGISAFFQTNANQNQINNNDNDCQGTVIGKKLHISPEMWAKANNKDKKINNIITYDYKTDIYSLGVTMFYLMTFQYPFAIDEKNKKRIKTNASIDQQRYDQKLIYIVMSMLEEDQNKRPSSIFIYNYIMNIIGINIDLKKISMDNIILKNNYIIKKSAFFSTIYSLYNISCILSYFKKDSTKNIVKSRKESNCFNIAIESFIEMINDIKSEKNYKKEINAIVKFVVTCSEKITIFKENDFTPRLIIENLFAYFSYNIKNIFTYNNNMALKICSLIEKKKNEDRNFSPIIEQKAIEFKDKYSNIFGHTFYFLMLRKLKCPKCNNIIEENVDIDFEIIFNEAGEINQLFDDCENQKNYRNEGIKSKVCNNCGLMSANLNQIETIYTAPNILIVHFNNACEIKENLEIIENINPNFKENYILISVIVKENLKNNIFRYNVSIRNINIGLWIYYSDEGSIALEFCDILKKGNICTAFYQRENKIN